MATINANTTHKMKTKKSSTIKTVKKGTKSSVTSVVAKTRDSFAPALHPYTLVTSDQIDNLKSLSENEAKTKIEELVSHCFGQRNPFHDGIKKPHTASTSRDRGGYAADIAVACKELGVVVVLKRYNVLRKIEATLLPEGICNTFKNADAPSSMKRIVSAASLSSMNSNNSVGTNSITGTGTEFSGSTNQIRGKPSHIAREGALLVLRALCDIVGQPSEPFVVPLLAACLDESRSTNGTVRDAAEDTSKAIIKLANPLAAQTLLCPVLFAALSSPEWRVKQNALDRLAQLAQASAAQIAPLLPEIIPKVSAQVWDTKPQVTKAASSCLLMACNTNINPDVKPAIPAVVNAIVKPSDTMKAVEELMGTTFVATVDASTLAILCPVLSRGLKQKVARDKRSCCVVIENMSRLVDSPAAVAPFGPLLVPDLKKVVENVQFEEMRDVALAALQTLTKALGHSSIEEAYSSIMAAECARVEEEQRRIEEEREDEKLKLEQQKIQEELERKQWKEAMEATRLLEQMKEKEEEEKKAEEQRKRELDKKSVKTTTGKCQGCGLKKCKKSCLFYSG